MSAYTGTNIEKGSLGTFLRAVTTGRIKCPCVLVVEALDRLTRLRVREARKLFEGLLEKGVKICTAHNGKLYDESSLDNPLDLIISLMEISASHQYAANIGRRVSAAWTRKKQAAAKGILLTKRVPGWMEIDASTNKITIAKEKGNVVKRIFKEYLEGKGARLIAFGLNRDRIPCFGHGKGWAVTTLRRILTSPSVIGDYQPQKYISKEKRVPEGMPVSGYYPAVVQKAVFYAVQERIKSQRTTRGARKHVFNLFSGLLTCARCSENLILKVGKIVKSGNAKPYVRLVCSKAWSGRGCMYRTIRYDLIERSILSLIWGRLINSLVQQNQTDPSDRSEWLGELRDNESKINRIKDLITGEAKVPKTIVGVLSKLEARREELRQKLDSMPRQSRSNKQFLTNWQPLENNIENRLKLQGFFTNIIDDCQLDPIKREGLIFFKGVGSRKIVKKRGKARHGAFKPLGQRFKWDDSDPHYFLWEGQKSRFLDNVLVWKSDENLGFPMQDLKFVAKQGRHQASGKNP